MTKDGEQDQEDVNLATTGDGTVLMGHPFVSGLDIMQPNEAGDADLSLVKKEDDDNEGGSDDGQLMSVLNPGANFIRTSHATLQSILSTPVSGAQLFAQQEGLQVIALPTSSDMLGMNTMDNGSQYVQVLQQSNGDPMKQYIGLIALPNGGLIAQSKPDIHGVSRLDMVQMSESNELTPMMTEEGMAALLMPPPTHSTVQSPLPSGCPSWAARLKKCEKIGDSFRGYVENEIDLDLILTLHKQQTNSFWGTRQSPSPAKSSTRLMWKSQYVPFDGIPFINAGSRAVVMECQYGPRRKGTMGKRGTSVNSDSIDFKQTCPARIYIKKVRKFPDYGVDLTQDKKTIRLEMDKAFHELREQNIQDTWGQERYYVQLPTDKAHDYHEEISHNATKAKESPTVIEASEPEVEEPKYNDSLSSLSGTRIINDSLSGTRIHPAVLEKIREMVASGETRLYAIRKQLRKFVVSDLTQGSGRTPERHDLTMFPTVNDLKNHIHQALKDIEIGVLPLYAPAMLNLHSQDPDGEPLTSQIKTEVPSEWGDLRDLTSPMPESVTVTLTQNPGEDGHHMISRIETHLSDGSTQISSTLNAETAQLLSRLHPGLFPAGSFMQADPDSPEGRLGHPLASDNPVSGMDAAMDEAGMPELDPSHLATMEDMDSSSLSTHNISDIIDADTASVMSGLTSDPSTIASLPHLVPHASYISHLDPHTSHISHLDLPTSHISGMMDPGLSSIVSSESHHNSQTLQSLSLPSLNIGSAGLSVLSGIDAATISEMVSSGAAHLSIVPGHPDTLALVAGGNTIGLATASQVSGLTLSEEGCESILGKGQSVGDEKMAEDKMTLHITSDQEIGMAQLENKVSNL